MQQWYSFTLSLWLIIISPFALADSLIWQQGQSFVSLLPAGESNNHPVNIATKKLVTLLKTVAYSNSNDDSQKQLFDNPKSLHLFAQNLSKALAKANARQDVRFLLLGKRRDSGFFGKLVANGGRIFYQNGKLNIIFSELLSTVDPKYIYGRLQPPRPWRDASRQVANTHKRALLTTAGIDKKRNDWIVIDTNFTVSAPLVKQQNTRVISPSPIPKAKMTLEQRLRKLKELKQKGLISDTIYQNKVNQILEAL